MTTNKPTDEFRVCPVCNKIFVVDVDEETVFCSHECEIEYEFDHATYGEY